MLLAPNHDFHNHQANTGIQHSSQQEPWVLPAHLQTAGLGGGRAGCHCRACKGSWQSSRAGDDLCGSLASPCGLPGWGGCIAPVCSLHRLLDCSRCGSLGSCSTATLACLPAGLQQVPAGAGRCCGPCHGVGSGGAGTSGTGQDLQEMQQAS
jgi:hypothetical protein